MIAISSWLLLLVAAADSSSAPDTTESPSPRVVRRLEEFVVRASPLVDPLSPQTVQRLTRDDLRRLPVDDLKEALGLQAGVVAQGEDLHVRGGRAGDAQVLLHGIPLRDPWRGRPIELPFLALESADLVSGALDPEYGGALAGVVPLRTVEPGPRVEAEARWESDSWLGDLFFDPTHYQRAQARVGSPLPGGWGVVAAADVLMDDTWLPALRSRSSSTSWRADNHVLGFLKASHRGGSFLWSLEGFGGRDVERPYDLMWSLDGYTTAQSGPMGSDGPAFSPDPMPGYQRYNAADHATMTDQHRFGAVLSGSRPLGRGMLRLAGGWIGARRLVSVGGRDDESYVVSARGPIFGWIGRDTSDPIYVYLGDEPFFQRYRAATSSARADWAMESARGARLGFGFGGSYDEVSLRELDLSLPNTGLDSLRAYRAFAPGGFAYAQGRWIYEGMLLSGGLRLEAFTAGPQAEKQALGSPARTHWSLSPRVGVTYPVSTRDAFSLAYSRIQQDPARDFLYENRTRIGSRQPLGNPALEPATVVSYQASLKHLFDAGRALQLSVYYRDLFGQIGARAVAVSPFVTVPRYENADEGHAEGFEIALTVPGRDLDFAARYTFLEAVGTQSPEEGYPFGTLLAPSLAPIAERPLDWDRRHTLALTSRWHVPSRPPAAAPRGPIDLVLRALRGDWDVSWSTLVSSPLPWTPSPRREVLTDPARVNSGRLDWEERTAVAVRWRPALVGRRAGLLLDVRNLFDFQGERAATLPGYPHPYINTTYDDYGAHRNETGLGGGGYWDSNDPDVGVWVGLHDPRLYVPPRQVRFGIVLDW